MKTLMASAAFLLLSPTLAMAESPDILDPQKSTKLESIRCELEGGEVIEMPLTTYFPEGDQIHAWYKAEAGGFRFNASFYSFGGMKYRLEVPPMPGQERSFLESSINWGEKLVMKNPANNQWSRGYDCIIRLSK